MQNHNNLWHLVARNLCNESTEEERENLNKILEEDPCLKFSMDILTNFWQSVNDENLEAAKKSSGRHVQRMEKQSTVVRKDV